LSIVKAIVNAHHGRIELESSQGHGSRFTLVIPATKAAATKAAAKQAADLRGVPR
jgi:signal transduction histidine kinase